MDVIKSLELKSNAILRGLLANKLGLHSNEKKLKTN